MKTTLILVVALAVLVAGAQCNDGSKAEGGAGNIILQALGEIEDRDIAKERVKVS